MSHITTLFSTILLLAPAGARAQETRLSRKEIPSAVLAAFEKAYPKATIKHAMKESKDGRTTIEIESLDGTTGRDLQYMADGMVMEIEETIPMSEIPAPVIATVKGKHPKGKIVKAEKSPAAPWSPTTSRSGMGSARFPLISMPAANSSETTKAGRRRRRTMERERSE